MPDGQFVAMRLMAGKKVDWNVLKGLRTHPNLQKMLHVSACLTVADLNAISRLAFASELTSLPVETVKDERLSSGGPASCPASCPASGVPAVAAAAAAGPPRPLAPPRKPRAPSPASSLSSRIFRAGLLLQRNRPGSFDLRPACGAAGAATAATAAEPQEPGAAPATAACIPFTAATAAAAAGPRPSLAALRAVSIGASSLDSTAAAAAAAAVAELPSPTDSTVWSPSDGSRVSLNVSLSEGATSPSPPSRRKHCRSQSQPRPTEFARATATAVVEAEPARVVSDVAAASSGGVARGGCHGGGPPSLSALTPFSVPPPLFGSGYGGGGGGEPSAASSMYGRLQLYDTVNGQQQVLQWLRAIGVQPDSWLTLEVAEWCDGGSLQHTLQQPKRPAALSRGSVGALGGPAAAGAAAGCGFSPLEGPPRRQCGTWSGSLALAGSCGCPPSVPRSELDDATLWTAHPAPTAATAPAAPSPPSQPGSGILSAAAAAPPLTLQPSSPSGTPAGGGSGSGHVPSFLVRSAGRIAALRCALQVAQALAHLHEAGLYHPDLNPTTILCCRVGGGGAPPPPSPPSEPASTAALLERLITSTSLGRIQCKVTSHGLAPVVEAAAAAAAASPSPPPPPSLPLAESSESAATASALAPPGGGADAAPASSAAASKPSLELSLKTAEWGAIAYVAPELVAAAAAAPPPPGEAAAAALAGPAANAFAFGMLLWQFLTGRTPHYELHPAQILVGRATGDLDASLAWPEDASEELRRLGQACLARDPARRPSLRAAAGVLSQELERETADFRKLLALHCTA